MFALNVEWMKDYQLAESVTQHIDEAIQACNTGDMKEVERLLYHIKASAHLTLSKMRPQLELKQRKGG